MIRLAQYGDRLAILDMCRKFHAESGVRLAFNQAVAITTIDQVIASPDALALVLELDDVIRGVFAAAIVPNMFSHERCAQEMMWWVNPAHRGRGAIQMLAEYEAWAKSKGCSAINMVGLGADPVTTHVYERCGYIAQERHFLKRL